MNFQNNHYNFMHSPAAAFHKKDEVVFFLWVKQEGEGCDYSIGCGQRMFQLRATTVEAAYEEARMMVAEHTHSEQTFKEAKIVRLMADVTEVCEEAVERLRDRKRGEDRDEKLRQFEKLKKELGV